MNLNADSNKAVNVYYDGSNSMFSANKTNNEGSAKIDSLHTVLVKA